MSEKSPLAITQSKYVKANVSNSLNDTVACDLKFSKEMTVKQLKNKLEIVTGGLATSMKVELYQGADYLTTLDNNAAKVGTYLNCDGLRLHVIDKFTNFRIDAENIKKFEMTNDQYEKRTDSVRNFLKMNQLGKYSDDAQAKLEAKRSELNESMQKTADLCEIGGRCQITIPGKTTRRATIMYKGPIDGKTGTFIGVRYDEPLGKNNGRYEFISAAYFILFILIIYLFFLFHVFLQH